MEVKINKEIRDYTEAIFFGLSLRQFIFSGLACGIAPCVVFGFVKYHGMTAEQFIWAWIKSEILMPKKLVLRSENLYFDAVEPVIKKYEKESLKKEGRKKNDKNAE